MPQECVSELSQDTICREPLEAASDERTDRRLLQELEANFYKSTQIFCREVKKKLVFCIVNQQSDSWWTIISTRRELL